MANSINLNVDQGSDFSDTIEVKDHNNDPFDLTNYEVRGMIRKSYASSSFYVITASIDTPPTEGKITIQIPSFLSNGMKSGRYVYDIEIYQISTDSPPQELNVKRIQEGSIFIHQNVTRLAPTDLSEEQQAFLTSDHQIFVIRKS